MLQRNFFLSSQRAKPPKVLFSSCKKMQMKDGRKFISVQLARRAGHKSGPSRSLKPTTPHLPHLQAYLTTLCRPWDRKYAFMSYVGQCDRVKSTDPWNGCSVASPPFPLPLFVSPSLALSLLASVLISWNTNVFCRLLSLLSGTIKGKWACREQGWGNNYLEKQMWWIHEHLNLAETDRDACREAKHTHSSRIMYDSACP